MLPFTPPPSCVPLADAFLDVATNHPNREMIVHLRDDGLVTTVTWRQFLADVRSRVEYFVEATGLSPRQPGEELVVVGLLSENTYFLTVNISALFFLRWTVCCLCSSHAI
jgi:hypothetical protein